MVKDNKTVNSEIIQFVGNKCKLSPISIHNYFTMHKTNISITEMSNNKPSLVIQLSSSKEKWPSVLEFKVWKKEIKRVASKLSMLQTISSILGLGERIFVVV